MGELTRRDKQVVGGMVALLVAGGGALVLSGEADRDGPATAPPERTVIAGAEAEMGPARRPAPGRTGGAAPQATAEAPAEIRTLTPPPGFPAVTSAATPGRTTVPALTPQWTPALPPPLVRPPLPTPTTPARTTTPATTKPATTKPGPATVPSTRPPATRPPVTRPPVTRPPATTAPPATTPPATTPPATTPAPEPTTPPVTEAPQEPAEPEPTTAQPQDDGGEDHDDHDFPWEPGAGGLPAGPGALTWPPAVPSGNPFE
ncbi:hypothetical protein ACPCHT_22485 [Nucisporomicrobium flavum]|uniref:hypothetical protein n=1 Tax=Nucisporomicrobium flavum TaxID=2785915 RepID=UPI003C3012CA